MKIFTTIPEARAACRDARASRKRLGLVPTMGALHEGHLSLVRAAKAQCGAVAVSIFVNPTQFGPAEDLSKYPRQFDRDCGLLEKEGVEILFAPPVEEIYPGGGVTWVLVESLSEKLDGRSRPGHFRRPLDDRVWPHGRRAARRYLHPGAGGGMAGFGRLLGRPDGKSVRDHSPHPRGV